VLMATATPLPSTRTSGGMFNSLSLGYTSLFAELRLPPAPTSRVLEAAREAANKGVGVSPPRTADIDYEEDSIVGRYVYLDVPGWNGRIKTFYETAGTGSQEILFLHTAGSDSRQFHGTLFPLFPSTL
jgi:hypothetical protein